jgi:hypothetical protein
MHNSLTNGAAMKSKTSAFMNGRAKFLCSIFCLIGICVPALSFAGSTSGQISSFALLGSLDGAPGAEDFRVYLGGTVFCNSNTWAYVNISDANYQVIVANLLSARVLGASVNINWEQQSNGYCEIDSVTW